MLKTTKGCTFADKLCNELENCNTVRSLAAMLGGVLIQQVYHTKQQGMRGRENRTEKTSRRTKTLGFSTSDHLELGFFFFLSFGITQGFDFSERHVGSCGPHNQALGMFQFFAY